MCLAATHWLNLIYYFSFNEPALMVWVSGDAMDWALEVSSGNDAVLLFHTMDKVHGFQCHELPGSLGGMQKYRPGLEQIICMRRYPGCMIGIFIASTDPDICSGK